MSPKAPIAAAVAIAAAIAPQAAQAMTVRIGQPELTAKMAVSVPVIVSCSPFDPALTLSRSSVSISVQQAAGKDIAYGSGGTDIMQGTAFTCDGAEQTVTVSALANTSGAPFHGGKAVISASAFAAAGVPCGWFPGCVSETAWQSAGTGPVAAKL